MEEGVRVVQIGEIRVAVLDVCKLAFDMRTSLTAEETEWRPRYTEYFAQPLALPVQCVHIQAPGASILVDATLYDLPPDSDLLVPGYTPVTDLMAQLRSINVAPEDVTHVVVTHAHSDHYNGLVGSEPGTLAFPNALCLLGKGDWERDVMQEALAKPDSDEQRSFGLYEQAGQLELVEDVRPLVEGVTVLPSPGETPGHLSVKVESGGEILYCIGDLYHHVVEVEQPQWAVTWSVLSEITATRQAFVPVALQENAQLVASHIPGIGQLAPADEGVRWESI
jgi:glyoxylase-like metal-dependent hydrolase (beta-lactamase superfamily II)